MEGFIPYGLTIREAIGTKFVYNSEYHFYQPAQEITAIKGEKEEEDHGR